MLNSKSYNFLIFALVFYLLAQTFQQYVRTALPVSLASGPEQSILASQLPLTYWRYYLVYLSMFLMIPGFIILGLHFYRQFPLLSILTIVFFLFFCLFEIAYRSVHIFQVMNVWGKEFVQAAEGDRIALLPKFQNFYDLINAIYFPLLSFLLLGSLGLLILSWQSKAWLVSVAMAVSSIQQISRLTGYTPFDFLNVFGGIWYFILVLISFGLLIVWAFGVKLRDYRQLT